MAALHLGIGIGAGLFALGDIMAGLGIRNPRRTVRAEECPGGALVGHPSDEAACDPPVLRPA